MREVLGLNRIGWRLLGAFLIVASLSIAVMVIGMLATEQQVHTQSSADTRTVLAGAAASAALAYARADGWTACDFSGEQVGATAVASTGRARHRWPDRLGSAGRAELHGPGSGRPCDVGGEDRGVSADREQERGRPRGSGRAVPLVVRRCGARGGIGRTAAGLRACTSADPPDRRYIDTARQFAAGDHSARPSDLGPPEFAEFTLALGAAADEIERSGAGPPSTRRGHRPRVADAARPRYKPGLRSCGTASSQPIRRRWPRCTIRRRDSVASSTTSRSCRPRSRAGLQVQLSVGRPR